MKHTIEISTAEALLVIQLLRENQLENETDKLVAERLKYEIISKVNEDLRK
jgi:hypothetical protein